MSEWKSSAVKSTVWTLAVLGFLGGVAWLAMTSSYRQAPFIGLLPPWFFVVSGAIGLAAAHAAWFLRKDPPLDADGWRDRKDTPARRRRLAAVRVAFWLAGLAAGAAWIWTVVEDAFDLSAFVLPVSRMGIVARVAVAALLARFWLDVAIYVVTARRLSIGLAFRLAVYGAPAAVIGLGRDLSLPIAGLAAAAFAGSWLMARPPYLRRTDPWWVLRKSRVDGRKRRLLREAAGLIIPLGLREERKFVEIPGPRGPVQVGRRATFSRCGWLSLCVLTILGTLALGRLKDHYVRRAGKTLEGVGGYKAVVTSRVLDRTGRREVVSYTLMNRTTVPLERIPLHVRQAFIAAEDRNFYQHSGIDPNAILRAAKNNFEDDGTMQGASTITQQVVKQVILQDASRTIDRKVTEIFLAVELERQVSKDRILEVYLNHNFLGENAYGVQAAAETYFGKDVDQLTLAEAAILAGLTKAPSRDSPDDHFENARRRQAYVLARMVEDGYVTEAQKEAALAERIVTIERGDDLVMTEAPHFGVRTRKWLQSRYGYDAVFKRGLTVRSTLDLDMQAAATDALRNGLLDLERKLGFEGPEGRDPDFDGGCAGPGEALHDYAIELKAPVVADGAGLRACVRGNLFPFDDEDVARIRRWEERTRKRLATGDRVTVRVMPKREGASSRRVVTAQRARGPRGLQGAIVAVDPRTGRLLAAVGGYDFGESQWDNATQSRRQPGSSIKPLVYANGFEHGMTVVDRYHDHPFCVGDWCFQNYIGKHTVNPYLGWTDPRTAMAKSANSVAVQIGRDYGFAEVIRLMRRSGYVTPMTAYPTLALGSEVVTLWEHVMGYAMIAADGRRMPSQPGAGLPGVFVTEVLDESGRLIERFDEAPAEQAISSGAAFLTRHVMRGVVEDDGGTGRRARMLKRPLIAKTGTSNDFKDVWFIGCTVDLCVGVWVGRDAPQPIGAQGQETTGGSVAVPIWMAFMQAVRPVTADDPALEFPVPSDILLMGDDGGTPFQAGRVPDRFLRRLPAEGGGLLFR